jgi:hypothetical protein
MVAALALGAPAGIAGQDAEWNRYTLENLGGVFVRIEVAEACGGAGVAAADFEAAASLKLIEGEVGVLTREEMLRNPALPELRVDVDCASGGAGATAWTVGLRVQQAAQMLRDTQVTLPEAVTWYTTRLGMTAGSNVKSDVEAALNEGLVQLVEAWTAANDDEGSGR